MIAMQLHQNTRVLLLALLSAAVLAQHNGMMMHGGMAGMGMGNDTGCANLDICVAGELYCYCCSASKQAPQSLCRTNL
jgi:hypothetical protein